MNLAGYAIRQKSVTLAIIVMVMTMGILSYQKIGRLEDPEFTIKTALIYTQYRGATAHEVELEVTEPLETAVQQLKQLDKVRSISRAGLSIIYVDIEDQYDKETLPQVWDELRRKVEAAAEKLPPGCGKPKINDDFGDVYGIFFAITGDGYSQHDLKETAEDLRRELLLCEDVGRIDFWGIQPEVVYVEINRTKLSQLGLSPMVIFNTISQQNTVKSAGQVQIGSENDKIRITGDFKNVADMGDILIAGGASGSMIRLKDAAEIKKGYFDPPMTLLYRDGKPAVGLGISTISGGNVVNMGDSVKKKLEQLQKHIPVGIKIHNIAYQADTVRESVNGFVLNLIEAVAIVILLLVIFMGIREGIIIGIILLLTILGTFIGMELFSINLQRISLGALVIALGMLVDNAIVVTEGIVIKLQRGTPRKQAAEETVSETQRPLFGATIIAILAFAAISISKDVTGEFLGSLFQVIGISLGLSWIFAVTAAPYLCMVLLKDRSQKNKNLYDNSFYRVYSGFLKKCIDHRWITLAIVGIILFTSLYCFKFVSKNFFPDSPRCQFMIDLYHPEGTHIEQTAKAVKQIEKFTANLDGVTDLTSFVGAGALRFILTYEPKMPASSYAMILVSVDDFKKIPLLVSTTARYLNQKHPFIVSHVKPFKLGPGGRAAVEARFSGPDPQILRSLAEKAIALMRQNPNAQTIKTDWGAKVKTVRVNMAEARSREIGVSRPDIARSLELNFSGTPAGLYRQGDELIPIMLRLPYEERTGVGSIASVQIWSNGLRRFIPIEQISDKVDVKWEDYAVYRRNRHRTIAASCEQITGTADTLFRQLRPQIEAIQLPSGYNLEWGGEHEKSTEANSKLMAKVPIAFALMFLITVMLFNTFRHPVIIFLGLPLALIGVTAGLIIGNQPFGFMATLGFLSLSGMLIKNEIVLLDQINLEIKAGKPHYQAVIDSAVSRVRPVAMASFTTVLGMIPLLSDAFFGAMAVTIMAGLTFATLLTLIVIPVLYATFFRVKKRNQKTNAEGVK